MPLATTLAGDKAAAQAGGVAAPYLGAALALKKTKHQKGFEKDIEAEEAKEAKDQGRLDQGQVAEAMNPIQAALTQQRAMMARGPQTGFGSSCSGGSGSRGAKSEDSPEETAGCRLKGAAKDPGYRGPYESERSRTGRC